MQYIHVLHNFEWTAAEKIIIESHNPIRTKSKALEIIKKVQEEYISIPGLDSDPQGLANAVVYAARVIEGIELGMKSKISYSS